MKRILVIDDDKQIRLMLQMTFEEAGFQVTVAVDGEDGVAKFAESPADLVVTDIVMPKKEGIGTIMELKRSHPDTKFIAISGGGYLNSEHYLEIAQILGVDKTFPKPLDRKELLEEAKRLLEES